MVTSIDPLYLHSLVALPSAISFALASLYFREFSQKVSPVWMNFFKTIVAFSSFGVSVLFLILFSQQKISLGTLGANTCFFLSGFVGLCLGDTFLMKAFKEIGAGRTLMIFSFNPIFLALVGAVVFGQSLTEKNLFAIVCLCLCVMVMGHESFLKEKKWQLQGLFFAALAGGLDALGTVLTRFGFETSPEVGTWWSNFARCSGALLGFGFLMLVGKKIEFLPGWRTLGKHQKHRVAIAAFFGTYFSLACWLWALSRGHLGITAGLAGTAPLFATLAECLRDGKRLNLHLFTALCLFGLGFFLILV